jgi:RNA polymerase sigma-70 factor (ECF subfamily)
MHIARIGRFHPGRTEISCFSAFSTVSEPSTLRSRDNIDTASLALAWFGTTESKVEAQPIELELVRRAQNGDEVVWCRWYDEYYPFLFRYALYRLRNREEAEDVAAQVFLEAVKHIDRYEPRGKPLLAWLYGIARNLTADRMRRKGREQAANERIHLLQPAAEDDSSIVVQVELERALGTLTGDQREVVVLRFRDGLSTREIAELTGRKETAIYSLQVRAIARLRRLLAA